MSPIERIEGIDDLRLIENGIKIRAIKTDKVTETVDTNEDLKESYRNDEKRSFSEFYT